MGRFLAFGRVYTQDAGVRGLVEAAEAKVGRWQLVLLGT
jgi:hypothetical protein